MQLSVLVAIMLLLEATGLGYIKTAGIEFTIMMVPVIVGAVILGPGSGAILGGMFGLTSFWEALSAKSVFGATILGINPFYAILVCMVPRILMGWLCGLIFRAMFKALKENVLSFAVASLSGALLNTVFFMTLLLLLFGNTDYIMGFRGEANIITFVFLFVGIQGLVEMLVCFFIGTAICKAVYHFMRSRPPIGEGM